MALPDNLASLAASFLGAPGNQFLADNGYQKLPSGLIIQWGRYATTSAASQNIPLPIPFPSTKFFQLAVRSNGAAAATTLVEASYVFTSLDSIPIGLTNPSAGIGVSWIAIGR